MHDPDMPNETHRLAISVVQARCKRLGLSPEHAAACVAYVEAKLITPGMLCNAGPDSGHRKPVVSCQNISSLSALKSALGNPFK